MIRWFLIGGLVGIFLKEFFKEFFKQLQDDIRLWKEIDAEVIEELLHTERSE